MRDYIFVKVNEFLSFAKNIGKNLSKNLSGIYRQNLFDNAKKSATNVQKPTLKRVIQQQKNW